MSNSVVRAIKQSLCDQLQAQAYFAAIPVFVVIPKDIFSQIEQGILPVTGGIAIFIEAFSAGPSNKENPGPYYEGGRITISVVEQPTLNKTNPDCDEVSETAQRYLQMFAPLGAQDVCWVSHPSEVENAKMSIRRFYVNLPLGWLPITLPSMPAIVATPSVGNGAYPLSVALALASPVPGAAIFYTIDGTFPAPLNPSAQLYQPYMPILDSNGDEVLDSNGHPLMTGTPVVIPTAGTRLRTRAYLAGYNSGPDAQIVFN